MNSLVLFTAPLSPLTAKDEGNKRGQQLPHTRAIVCSGLYLSHQGLDGLQRPELTSMT
uniref:Uncharacterized protein n=1 Tax=Helianthus annuus TaxID=4232 RepID=A0A251S7K3_HELAN